MSNLNDSIMGDPDFTMTLVNMVNNQALDVQFQPEDFEENIGVTYAELTVPGLSHKILQYINTENVKYAFTLNYHSRGAGNGTAQFKRLMQARQFLYALTHPSAGTTRSGGAPRALFIWPNLISLSCVVRNMGFKYTAFNKQRTPIAFSAKVDLTEIRDVHVTMEEVFEQGTIRSNSKAIEL